MQPVGAARMEIEVKDYSSIIATGLKGITGVLLQTQYGEVGVARLIGTVQELYQYFGGAVANLNGFLLARRALERGGKLSVVRAAKYTNPSDKTTVTGVKATDDFTQAAAAATGASGTVIVSGVTTPSVGAVNLVVSRPGMPDIILASNVSVGVSANATAAAIASAITGGSSGYTATNTSSPNVLITAPASVGAAANSYTIKITAPSNITFASYNVAMAGGNDTTVATGTVAATAKSIGTWANGVILKAVAPASNILGNYDIVITPTANTPYIVEERYFDFPKAASDPAFATKTTAMIQSSQIISEFVTNADFVLQPSLVLTLAAGADSDTMSANDYIGDVVGGTNLHAFDEVSEISKLAILDIADPISVAGLANYVDARKDIMGLHTTPVNIGGQTVVDFRQGSGSYNHVPVDSWRNIMFTGGLRVINPDTGNEVMISELGDAIGVIGAKDNNTKEWFSFSGEQRGRVTNANGVVYNVGTPARLTQMDNYDVNGINPVIQNSKKQLLFWGNSTLWKGNTLLRKAEVAELVTLIIRTLNEIVPYSLFDPNDTTTWKDIYRRVQPFMEALKDGRAIWDYEYQGDQDAMQVSDAIVNRPEDIDAGMYHFVLWIKPKVAMKYVLVTIAVTNSGIEFSDITEA